jgi:predicted nucleic acid-binding protein
LDASVATKWFLPAASEPLSAEAAELLLQYAKGQANFLVPDLFFAELANVLCKAERRGRCDAAVTDAAIAKIVSSGFPTFPSATLVEPAVQIRWQVACLSSGWGRCDAAAVTGLHSTMQ